VAYHMPAIHNECRNAIRGNQVPFAGTGYITFVKVGDAPPVHT